MVLKGCQGSLITGLEVTSRSIWNNIEGAIKRLQDQHLNFERNIKIINEKIEVDSKNLADKQFMLDGHNKDLEAQKEYLKMRWKLLNKLLKNELKLLKIRSMDSTRLSRL